MEKKRSEKREARLKLKFEIGGNQNRILQLFCNVLYVCMFCNVQCEQKCDGILGGNVYVSTGIPVRSTVCTSKAQSTGYGVWMHSKAKQSRAQSTEYRAKSIVSK